MVSNNRARTGADKLARRMQILDAALQLWEETSYAELTMAQVAIQLSLAKGTLYLYFTTKEELFLAIAIQLLDEWFDRAELAIEDLTQVSPVSVSQALVDLLVARPRLARLIPLLTPTLERNSSEEANREYKEWLGKRLTRLGETMEDKLPGLSPGTGHDATMYFFALAAGLEPMSDPARALMEEAAFREMKMEFGPALQTGFAALLTGFQRKAR